MRLLIGVRSECHPDMHDAQFTRSPLSKQARHTVLNRGAQGKLKSAIAYSSSARSFMSLVPIPRRWDEDGECAKAGPAVAATARPLCGEQRHRTETGGRLAALWTLVPAHSAFQMAERGGAVPSEQPTGHDS